ncbi:MAG: cysteine desulfurase family protein, partial [Dehalococcoidia bacterium]
MKHIYMDYAATTPMLPEVAEAMQPYFSQRFGNPSSIHSMGQESRDCMDQARSKVAELIACRPEEVVFTGGGTEADNHAIKGVCLANRERGNHIVTTSIEHHAVLNTCNYMKNLGFDVTVVPVDQYGMVDPDRIKKSITAKTLLVSVMHANNEVGAIQPIEEIASITRQAGVYFHVDAVQTAGHLPIDVNKLGIDLLSASAHKLYGPKGVGMLYVREGTRIAPLLHGGEQENERRAGTENVPGIAGFGKAAEIALAGMGEEAGRLTKYRDRLIDSVMGRVADVYLNGHRKSRLPNNANFSFDFIEGESILMYLDAEGICASTGSACSSSAFERSHFWWRLAFRLGRAGVRVGFTRG